MGWGKRAFVFGGIALVAAACATRDDGWTSGRDPIPGATAVELRYGQPTNGPTQTGSSFETACAGLMGNSTAINAYCAPLTGGGVWPTQQAGNPNVWECWCSGGTDPCDGQGCNNPDPACQCPNNGTCGADGKCGPCLGARCMDAGPPACMQGEPTYPPKTENEWSVNVGFEFPAGASSAVCAFMSTIPYVGSALFNGDGISISGTLATKKTDEWIATCHHEKSSSASVKPTALICGLQLDGNLTLKDVDTTSSCVECGPPPTCNEGEVACTKHSDTTSVDVNVSKVWDIGLASQTCSLAPQKKSWKQWLLSNTNLTVRAGVGAGGGRTKTEQTAGTATKCPTCTNCTTTEFDGHVNANVGARAELTTPSWIGLSGSAYVDLSGQVRGGYKGTTSTCGPYCGGPYLQASATLELGLKVSAILVSYGGSWRWTCLMNKSFSDCPGASAKDEARCGWSEPGDP